LRRLADSVLQPGFEGTRPPDWLRRRIADGLGGVTLYARNIESPVQLAALTAALRAEHPDVVVAIDEEAGDVTRIEARTGSSRPGNLALGAIDDVTLTESVAAHLGRDLASVGVTLDYAPDADVNTDPDNPVIGSRAFGADPELVGRHTAAWVRGLQSSGVAACAKHFPGHGNTSVDSHLDLPVIKASRAELDTAELVPFRAAIEAGVRSVMSAHLRVPAIDPDLPATLSWRIMTELLRQELGFTGLIVTDAIEMRAVADQYGIAGATVAALVAGADAVCVGGEHADEATAVRLRDAIVDAVISGVLPQARLVDAAARVAALAAWTAQARTCVSAAVDGAGPGLAAARRAVRVTIADGVRALPVDGAPHVVEFQPSVSLAIAPETPWGVADQLTRLLPATTSVRLTASELGNGGHPTVAALRAATGRPLVLVVRDAHRHPWMADAVRELIAERPDAVVVEMGIPVQTLGAVHVATHGATLVNGQAAAELLAGNSLSSA
jgi:beta-N-acetylhexosaminidase